MRTRDMMTKEEVLCEMERLADKIIADHEEAEALRQGCLEKFGEAPPFPSLAEICQGDTNILLLVRRRLEARKAEAATP